MDLSFLDGFDYQKSEDFEHEHGSVIHVIKIYMCLAKQDYEKFGNLIFAIIPKLAQYGIDGIEWTEEHNQSGFWQHKDIAEMEPSERFLFGMVDDRLIHNLSSRHDYTWVDTSFGNPITITLRKLID